MSAEWDTDPLAEWDTDPLVDWERGAYDGAVDPDEVAEGEEHALDTSAKLCASSHPDLEFVSCRRMPGHNGRCSAFVGNIIEEWMPE